MSMSNNQGYAILKKKIEDISGGGDTLSEGNCLRIKVMDRGEYEALLLLAPGLKNSKRSE